MERSPPTWLIHLKLFCFLMIKIWLYVYEGGGYALSEATKVSHLDQWLGNKLIALNALPPFAIMIVTSFITSSVTEVIPNVATAAIFLPVLVKLV
jgi:di/tricarboxylate transporter